MPALIRINQKRLLFCGALALFFGWTMNLIAQDKLIFVIDVIRHGDRTPTRELPGAPASLWPQGLGQLTELGQRQEAELGARQRARCEAGGLFGAPPSADSMRVYSTELARTRASARCFLQGFLGDTNKAKTIPILPRVLQNFVGPITDANSIPASPLMIPTARADYQELLRNYVYDTREWRQTNAALAEHFVAWNNALETQIKTVHDTISPGDTVWIHQMHRLPYPGHLSESAAQALIDACRWTLCYQYAGEVGQISGGPLLARLADYLKTAQTGQNGSVKYILFSAHDSTLLSLLSALRVPLRGNDSPPYASSLRFALSENPAHRFEIHLTYNDGVDHLLKWEGATDWSGAPWFK